jgi:phosphomethylpyrimidine synthase
MSVAASMNITQEIRDYAAQKGIADTSAAVEMGLGEKASEFKEHGAEVYKKL